MARVTRGVRRPTQGTRKVLEQAKGFHGRRKNTIRTAKAAVDKAGQYAYRDRKVRKRMLPRAVDPAHQRGGPAGRLDLLAVYARPGLAEHRHRPQGPGRCRRVPTRPRFKAIADKVRAALA